MEEGYNKQSGSSHYTEWIVKLFISGYQSKYLKLYSSWISQVHIRMIIYCAIIIRYQGLLKDLWSDKNSFSLKWFSLRNTKMCTIGLDYFQLTKIVYIPIGKINATGENLRNMDLYTMEVSSNANQNWSG